MEIRLESFSKSFGDVAVIENLDLTVESGEMLALLGPSGCGKTTTLFAICGIHRVTAGRILFDGRDVGGLPARERNVGVVFQSYALYPHLTVFENIAFPLRVRRVPSAELKRQVRAAAELVQIEPYLERRPAQLSGGQQQRVALARAMIRRPDVLLLDEPLANLDAKLRLEMRSELRRVQRETGITAILVTHDQVEAMSMCDRIAIMRDGQILQVAAPKAMYDEPADRFVAGFLGNPPISFLEGVVGDGAFTRGDLRLPLPPLHAGPPAEGRPITIGVRPEHLQPGHPVPIAGAVDFVEPHGREVMYDIRLADGSVLRSIQPDRGEHCALGGIVEWGIRTPDLLVFDESGARL